MYCKKTSEWKTTHSATSCEQYDQYSYGKKVNDKFDEWLNKMYGGYGKVIYTRVKVYDYLGMTIYLYEKKK